MNSFNSVRSEAGKILIVEDSPTQAELLRYILSLNKYEVEWAVDGGQALALLERSLPTVVISDIIMPGISGYELCRHIKNNPQTQNLPVILLTSLSDPLDVVRGLECGADTFLFKPFESNYLLKHVSYVIANRHLVNIDPASIAIEVSLGDKNYRINTHRLQILNQLLTTYEAAVQKNSELKSAQEELRLLNEQLEQKVKEKTLGLEREIRERIQVETSLQNAQSLYASLVENIPQYIYRLDLQGCFVFANRNFCRLVKTDDKSILYKRYENFFPAELAHKFNQYDQYVVETKRSFESIEDIPVEGNGKMYARVTRFPFYDHEKTIQGIQVIVGDISEKVLQEESKKQLERQLQQSQKLETLGQLAESFVHDINHHCMLIDGFSERAINLLDKSESARSSIEEIREAGNKISSLTGQLLSFSKKQDTQSERVNLNKILLDMEPLLKRLTKENTELLISSDPKIDPIKADPGQLEQLFINLVTNALEAMPGGGKILIHSSPVTIRDDSERIRIATKPGNYTLVTVSDTGMGMDSRILSQVFEPFFTTKGKKHAGLGLATVLRIVQQSSGTVSVYSEPGQGSTFKMYFPSAEETTDSNSKTENPHLFQGNETLLLVEDDEDIRKLISFYLKKCGYTVLAARDADEAIEIADNYPSVIHLLITDIMMPRMNGHELGAWLASSRPRMKIIYMSGYSPVSLRKETSVSTSYLMKPFSSPDLLKMIREMLDRKK